jgi:hypothetical protein
MKFGRPRCQVGGNGVSVPVDLLIIERRLAGRGGDGAEIRADEAVDVLAAGKLLDRGDALLRGRGVAAHDFEVLAEHAPLGVHGVGAELIASSDFIAIIGHRPRQGIDGADLDGLLGPGGVGRENRQAGGRAQEQAFADMVGHLSSSLSD